jgi:hypothetical protein
MRKIFLPLWGLMILTSCFFSCASVPKTGVSGADPAELPPEAAPSEGVEASPPAQGEVSVAIPPETTPEPVPEVLLEPAIRTHPEIPPLTALDAPLAAPPGSFPEAIPEASPETFPGPALAALPPEAAPQSDVQSPPERLYPPTPERILGTGQLPFSDLASFLRSVNSDIDPFFIEELAHYYIEEAAQEGVNHDVAFAQMCLETGFLRYGGLVTPDMNNFCGLGAIGPDQQGAYFPSPQIGARAHIQHLKAYATDAPLQQELVDPRYRLVRYGSSPTLDGLAGSWAADQDYSKKIRSILERLYAFALTPPEPAREPVQSAEVQPDEVQADEVQVGEVQVEEVRVEEVQVDGVQPDPAVRPVSAVELIPNRPAQSGGS